mmetsp:Transcript_26872/g.27097  ORF Transcript_26872/g.27097 Transcript_26872/m.27097 type:complete len:227 (+) Transcript_26872:212-892(+)
MSAKYVTDSPEIFKNKSKRAMSEHTVETVDTAFSDRSCSSPTKEKEDKMNKALAMFRMIIKILRNAFCNMPAVSAPITKKYPSGDIYVGEMMDGLRNGKGIYTYHNGDVYEGQYKDDIKHGFGIYKHASGAMFQGEYRNDERNGTGIFIYSNGDRYEGEYQDDLKHGRGIFTSAHGGVIDGDWHKGNVIKQGFGFSYENDGPNIGKQSELRNEKNISSREINFFQI